MIASRRILGGVGMVAALLLGGMLPAWAQAQPQQSTPSPPSNGTPSPSDNHDPNLYVAQGPNGPENGGRTPHPKPNVKNAKDSILVNPNDNGGAQNAPKPPTPQ